MKTYWHQHRDTIDRLAADYALGNMPAPARRRFEALMRERQDVSQAVWAWHGTLSGALTAQKPLPVDPAQWRRLAARLHFTGSASETFAKPRAWWSRWFAPIPASALAFGLALGLLMPLLRDAMQTTQLPESYVGVLATPDGQAGMIVSSLRQGLVVDLKQVALAGVPQGKTLYLWSIDKAGRAHAIAPLPDKRFTSVRLASPSEQTFLNTRELAVSVEAQGVTPAEPAGAFVYRGLCGKIWAPKGTAR